MDIPTANYVHDLFLRATVTNDNPSLEYKFKEFIPTILKWVAETLESEDALLLSKPDSKDRMFVVKSGGKEIKGNKYLMCEKAIKTWMQNTNVPLSLNDTTHYSSLQSHKINSFLIVRLNIESPELRRTDICSAKAFQEFLFVFNRLSSGLNEHKYCNYDFKFCTLIISLFELYFHDSYKMSWDRYCEAKNTHIQPNNIYSLKGLQNAAHELIDFYKDHRVTPPASIFYDYLDSIIALYNAKQISANALAKELDDCHKLYLSGKVEVNYDDVLYALSRGFFALGTQDTLKWNKGKKYLDNKVPE